MEAGDKHHGAPMSFINNDSRGTFDSKHEVRMALKKVKEMGQIRRREEFLKIRKENGHYAMR
jgi:hypothetical protein